MSLSTVEYERLGGMRKIAESPTTGTIADKLMSLSSAFNSLSEQDKINSIVIFYTTSSTYFRCMNGLGTFESSNITNGGTIRHHLLKLSTGQYARSEIKADRTVDYIDEGGLTNTYYFILYVVE